MLERARTVPSRAADDGMVDTRAAIARTLEKMSDEGRPAPGATVARLRAAFIEWRDHQLSTDDLMYLADSLVGGEGVKRIANAIYVVPTPRFPGHAIAMRRSQPIDVGPSLLTQPQKALDRRLTPTVVVLTKRRGLNHFQSIYLDSIHSLVHRKLIKEVGHG